MHLKPSLGILKMRDMEKKYKITRHAPSGDLAFFVKHYWIVSWDLTGEEPYLQHVIPNPCVNMVIEHGKSGIFGPAKHKFSYLLKEKGCVFGVKFKPGGFYPFCKRPISSLTERAETIAGMFGADAGRVESSILSQTDERRMVELAEKILRPKLPDKDENIIFVNRIIDRINEDRDIIKVDGVCRYFHINIRKLQRLFDQYVGVSPKWVIKLCRLQNAAESVDRGQACDWLKLSSDLGYFDQSHFIKDFRTVIGQTPEEYARGKN